MKAGLRVKWIGRESIQRLVQEILRTEAFGTSEARDYHRAHPILYVKTKVTEPVRPKASMVMGVC